MRKKIAAAGAALLGVALLGAGGTYASYTDTETTTPVLIQAGTLDLRLSTADDQETEPLTFSDVAPGPVPRYGYYQPSEHHYFVKLTNDGSVGGVAKWASARVAENENGCNAPEQEAGDRTCGEGPGEGELGNQLRVSFSLLPGADCTGPPGVVPPEQYPATRTEGFQSIKPGGSGDELFLAPGASRCVRIDVYFPSTPHNNIAQTDSSTFRLSFRLDQV